MNFNNCEFSAQRVELDGNSYTNVVFTNCIMVFNGSNEEGISLVGCSFDNCSWHFEGAAANTLTFINNLAGAMGSYGGKRFIKSLFKNKL
ncbi:hypothetical protein K5E59_000898 [Enterobacter hormaechei]|nr:hypothetical protein [Enterobacter hormaechei]